MPYFVVPPIFQLLKEKKALREQRKANTASRKAKVASVEVETGGNETDAEGDGSSSQKEKEREVTFSDSFTKNMFGGAVSITVNEGILYDEDDQGVTAKHKLFSFV